MMNESLISEQELRLTLADLPLAGVRFFARVGSTNDVAREWAAEGAPDMSLVVAEEQTHGRGRGGRHWESMCGGGLALSLVLRLKADEVNSLGLVTALGAVAVSEAVEALGLPSEIKWPNDVLVNDRKTCGVLAEANWQGEQLEWVVVGMGVNVAARSVPGEVQFPATCLEAEAGRMVDRLGLYHDLLQALVYWRPRFGSELFLRNWSQRLAYRNQAVEVLGEEGEVKAAGVLMGLERDGRLQVKTPEGRLVRVGSGEVHLRKVV